MLVCGAVVVNKYTLCVFGPSRILILRAGNVHFSSEHAALMFSRFLSQKPPEAILAIIIFKIFLGGGCPQTPLHGRAYARYCHLQIPIFALA